MSKALADQDDYAEELLVALYEEGTPGLLLVSVAYVGAGFEDFFAVDEALQAERERRARSTAVRRLVERN